MSCSCRIPMLLSCTPMLVSFTTVLMSCFAVPDADVIFRRPFSFHEFPLPLPSAIGLSPEVTNSFPYSVGVMLLNLPTLRTTYTKFLEFVMKNENGRARTNQVGGDGCQMVRRQLVVGGKLVSGLGVSSMGTLRQRAGGCGEYLRGWSKKQSRRTCQFGS